MSPSQLVFSISTRTARRTQKTVLVLALLMALWAIGLPGASALTPTLATDKQGYSPGETVHITGTGYNAGASYDIPVRRPDGTIVTGDGSQAPGWDTTVADGSGNLAYDYKLDGMFGLYEARAYPSPWSGDWSEAPLASVTFRDGVNLDQCANDEPDTPPCAWQNGNLNGNNSAYAEGDVVPFRLAIDALTAGTHTIHLNYDFTQGGHKAYDFLATYDATEDVDLCAPGGGGVSNLCPVDETNPDDTETFPSDDTVVDGLSVAGAEADFGLGRELTIFGGTITSITPADPVHAGDTDGNSTADFLVTFTSTGSDVLLAWGGHIADSDYWNAAPPVNGPADGAGQINGAPWHMRTQNLDGGGASNQDRSIQPSALIVTQSITVVKDTVPDGPQDFTFDPDPDVNNDTNFVLDDDGPDGSDTPSELTFEVAAGEHHVTELTDLVPGFDLTDIVCDDPTGDSFGVLPPDGSTAVFIVAPGESVTCTFTNEEEYGNEPLDEEFDHPHDDYDYDSDDNGGVDNPHDDGSMNQGDPGAPATQGDPGSPASGQAPSTPLSDSPLDILGTTVEQPQPAPDQSQAALEQPASEIAGNVVISADELPRTGAETREEVLLALILLAAGMARAARRRPCSESA